MLHNIKKGINFIISGEAEIGNAGEQPTRNNPIDWNGLEVDYKTTSIINHSFWSLIPKKTQNVWGVITQFILVFCPIYAGAVHYQLL